MQASRTSAGWDPASWMRD